VHRVVSGEELLSLIKQSPQSSADKRHHQSHGKDRDDDRPHPVPSMASRDLHSKARPAAELEEQWKKEVDVKKAQEDEERRLEEERQRHEEEKAEQERLEKVR